MKSTSNVIAESSKHPATKAVQPPKKRTLTNADPDSNTPITEANAKKQKKTIDDDLTLVFLHTYWRDERGSPMTNSRAQYAIDAGLNVDLQSKIFEHFKAKCEYGWPRSTENKNLTFFYSWLADGILRVQNEKAKEITDNKKSTKVQRDEEPPKEQRFEDLTAAWNALTRLETFIKSQKENTSYQEYRKFQEFEKTKHDDANYRQYLAFQDVLRSKKSDEVYKEFLEFKEFKRQKGLSSQNYKTFVSYQKFEKTVNTNPLVQKMKDIEHIQRLMENAAKNAEGPKTD